MQQRQLRLGDVLDDYCPRERRITDHAIVALVGDVVKQTRCTTCEAEHEYKHGKAPTLRKKKETPTAPINGVAAASDPAQDESHTQRADGPGGSAASLPLAAQAGDQSGADQGGGVRGGGDQSDPNGGEPETPATTPEEEGPVHRRLIRATLPRPEGQPPAARPLPDFTVRRPGNRPGGYPSFRDRDRDGMGNRQNNGSRGGGFGRSAGPKSDFGRQGRGDSRPGRRSHGPRRGGGGGGKKH